MGDASDEDSHFSYTEPHYDPKSNGFWLYPRATSAQVAAGASARIEFVREFVEFDSTDTVQEAPIDRQFRDLIPIRASFKWAVMKDAQRASNLKVLYDEGIQRLAEHYGTKNIDEQLVFTPQTGNYK